MSSLFNPTDGTRPCSRVMADLDDDVFNYFFSASGDAALKTCRGARQALIAQFFSALHTECLARGIPPQWEPENCSRVQDIMNTLNFNAIQYDI